MNETDTSRDRDLEPAPGRPKQASAPLGGSAGPSGTSVGAVNYLLHLADNALVLAQRNAEWCGHGPILEEDLALSNMSLDLIGQARLLYQEVARLRDDGSTEDSLAYFRDAPQFLHWALVELPHHGPLVGYAPSDIDYAVTVARNFLYSAYMALLWEQLQASGVEAVAAIAAKSLKEARYHLRHARDWVLRLGDGTEDSHQRVQAAFDHLMPYTQEFWSDTALERSAAAAGLSLDLDRLQAQWTQIVDSTLNEATLRPPATQGYVTQGKQGLHTEHLSYLLAEMQSLARAHPGATW